MHNVVMGGRDARERDYRDSSSSMLQDATKEGSTLSSLVKGCDSDGKGAFEMRGYGWMQGKEMSGGWW